MKFPELSALTQQDAFIHRHIGPSDAQIGQMLTCLGLNSLDELIQQTVPTTILRREGMNPEVVGEPLGEAEALARLRALAAQNHCLKSYIGMGYYNTLTPAVIQRNVLENPGWYTAYTPYQPEISQGRLEGLLNFQQMIIDLSGMEMANASLLDEGTAAAEAMALCKRVAKGNTSDTFFVADDCHPQTIAVVRTRARHYGFDVVVGDPEKDLSELDVFGVLLQYPGSDGRIRDIKTLIAQAHARQALVTVATDLLSLCLLTPPGELDADVVIGNSQRFGVPMGYGGPHAAFLATREQFKRSIPGRIIGVSKDVKGRQALRMALQTREQHIRREKANSNICTAQSLLAIMAMFYAVYHGPQGLRTIALRVHRLTAQLARGLSKSGITLNHTQFFDTLSIDLGQDCDAILATARQRGFNLRRLNDTSLGISLDETTTAREVETLLDILSPTASYCGDLDADLEMAIPDFALRSSGYLSHPVFNSYHSETEMLRYMHRLETRDIALNRSMIALGSCTMKLNATAEMLPVTWPEFAGIHPFVPKEQVAGYTAMIDSLEAMLVEATGYDAISMQPNAGSQGEYAGLLAIKKYHAANGEAHRNVCLIPSSAHGTNPATAAMAGLKVVIVKCDDNGNVDVADLSARAEQYRDTLAALMVTYPSTHGVFEAAISEICAIIHQHGGQVYLDGANMNALVGIAAPGKFGADVSHLNLHKTFAIPHGGGGPGMGPIGIRAHLAPYVSNHPISTLNAPLGAYCEEDDVVASAAWGSAGILPISWMYITMLGARGLTRATQVAILNANYLAQRLSAHYPVLYTGANGRVAHECIIDLRPIKEHCGISEEDIAKRLMDYGFHAPTMSFPVAGTLMIEPTESESQAELDRFIDAMAQIRQEIRLVENGEYDAQDNPLKNAPHSLADISADEWPHCYSRDIAAFPLPWLREDKYWPPVNRIDNVYGDRNLFCSCPAVADYA